MRARMLGACCLFFVALAACDCSNDGAGGPIDGSVMDATVVDARPDVLTNVNCGDGQLQPGETCDDANTASDDGCSSNCILEPGYACPAPGQTCVGCGDTIIQVNETCDDGGQANGDGCSALCQREVGWDCVAEVCTPAACGDGHRVGVRRRQPCFWRRLQHPLHGRARLGVRHRELPVPHVGVRRRLRRGAGAMRRRGERIAWVQRVVPA